MLTVDRTELMAWASGVLLDFRAGRGIAVHEAECEAAEAALERGDTVLLRAGAELTGTEITLVDGAFVERPTLPH